MTKAEMMSWIFYLLIYLLTLSLIGCQPSNTCYYDVSENQSGNQLALCVVVVIISIIIVISIIVIFITIYYYISFFL